MSKPIKIISVVILAVVVISIVIWLLSGKSATTSRAGIYQVEATPASFGLAMNAKTQEAAMVASDANLPSATTIDRMIIKTGSLSLVVKDVKQSVEAIVKYAVQHGGFVVSSNIEERNSAPYATVTVRILSDQFDAGVKDIKAMGEVKNETVNGQDVTEEYVDLDSQLKNLQAAETQFLSIMQRAIKIEDILAVQRELTTVRGRIEGLQGQMKYLKESARLSTITVYVSTDPNVLPVKDDQNKWKPWAEVKDNVRGLITVGQKLVNLLIWLVVYIPLWMMIFIVVWTIRHYYRKRRKNSKNFLNN
jgi:uncharacterized protein YebE (UPF0316 family)